MIRSPSNQECGKIYATSLNVGEINYVQEYQKERRGMVKQRRRGETEKERKREEEGI
jgi:hypothetical protein